MNGHSPGYPFLSTLEAPCPGCGGGPVHLYGGWLASHAEGQATYGAIVECALCRRAGSASGTTDESKIQKSALQNFEEFPGTPGIRPPGRDKETGEAQRA